jgi:hypothetical protein
MRLRALALALAVLVAITACGDKGSTDDAAPSPAPTAVSCADAPQLRQRAVDDRRESDERTSDQEKIYIGNRAGFFASLAIIADLKCEVTLAEADEALKPAFDAARKAEGTRSMYERAFRWGQAAFIATQVIALLVQQLPAPPSK